MAMCRRGGRLQCRTGRKAAPGAHPDRRLAASAGAFLLLRGLATLRLRVLAAQDNAILLATRLAKPSGVARCTFRRAPRSPGRHRHAPDEWPRLRAGFRTACPDIDADRMLQSLRLITPAVSLGSVDTLIQRPAGPDPPCRRSRRERSGISEGLLRLSVGIEDATTCGRI
jgi:methionine-gamma-lyase